MTIYKGLYDTSHVRGITLHCIAARDCGAGRFVYEDEQLRVAFDGHRCVVHKSNILTYLGGRAILTLPWTVGPRSHPQPILPSSL